MRRSGNIPAMIVAILGGVLVSMVSGLLLASYAVAGVTPSYLRTPFPSRVEHVPTPEMTTVQQIAARVSAAQPAGGQL